MNLAKLYLSKFRKKVNIPFPRYEALFKGKLNMVHYRKGMSD